MKQFYKIHFKTKIFTKFILRGRNFVNAQGKEKLSAQ